MSDGVAPRAKQAGKLAAGYKWEAEKLGAEAQRLEMGRAAQTQCKAGWQVRGGRC